VLEPLSDGQARAALVAGALVAGAIVVAVPRRWAWTAAAVVGVTLALASYDSGRRIVDASAHEDRVATGSAPPAWLDDAGLENVTLLATGDRLWTSTARTVFWNHAIGEVLRIAPTTLPFPPVTPEVGVGEDGVLRAASGDALRRSVVVAPSTLAVAGEKVAERPLGDSQTYGLIAWRPDVPVRILWRTEGILPNGDFGGTARITVYACRPGTLDITVIGKTGDPIRAYVDGFEVDPLETPAEESATHSISTPPYADGTRICFFDLATEGFAGTTTIQFRPEG